MFISHAYAQTTDAASSGTDTLLSLLPLALMFVVLYFVMIRPQQKAAKAQAAAAASSQPQALGSAWTLMVPRGSSDTFSRAELLREQLAEQFKALTDPEVLLTTYKSSNGSSDVWLRLEVLRQHSDLPELCLRSVIVVRIDRLDFHRFEHVIHLEIGRGTFQRKIRGLTELREADIRALMAFAAGKLNGFPGVKSTKVRRYGWDLWRPNNRIKRVRRDWVKLVMNYAGLLLIIGAGVPIFSAFSNDEFQCGSVAQCTAEYPSLYGVLCGFAILGASWWRLRRQCIYVLNTGKPHADPRTLIRMDSWQVMLNHLGDRRAAVQTAIMTALQSRKPPGLTLDAEWIGYASVDSKVEREQHVMTFRRAIAFLRLESYGEDLYVGWDSHVNAGFWTEQDVGQGVDRVSGTPVVARRVVDGWRAPSEYDVGDASFVTEWLHACVVNVIKQQMAEYRIDQDIDFTIQRESRADALQSRQTQAPKKSFGAGLRRAA